MTQFSLANLFGVTIRESANDGSDFTNPDVDYRRLFLGEDGLLHLKDSAGTVTDIGAGSVATDTIWDAAGDLAVGSGANTAAKLTAGADSTVLTISPSTHVPVWSAPAGGSVPGWIGWFIGTTDATNFYWDGNDLAGFTEQTVTGTTTWVEGNNLISALTTGMTANDASCQLIAKTISIGDAWVLAVNMTILGSDVSNGVLNYRAAGIVFADGTTTTSNCVIGHVQIDNGGSDSSSILVGRHGTLTDINTGAPFVTQKQVSAFGGWVFIKLTYQAANTFRLQFGPSPSQFTAFGEADISKTMTPTHVGLFVADANGTHISAASFGPLRKI